MNIGPQQRPRDFLFSPARTLADRLSAILTECDLELRVLGRHHDGLGLKRNKFNNWEACCPTISVQREDMHLFETSFGGLFVVCSDIVL